MSGEDFYYTQIVREKTIEPPLPFESEELIAEYVRTSGVGIWLILLISLFVWPLLPIAIAIILWDKLWHLKKSKLYITNKRIVYSNIAFKTFVTQSVPIHQIKTIRRASLDNPFIGMLDRIFGSSDIQIWTDESILRQLVLDNVKQSKNFVETVERLSGRKIIKM